MRPSWWLCLVIVCVAALAVRAAARDERGAAVGDERGAKAGFVAVVEEKPVFEKTIRAQGDNIEEARIKALGHARKEIADYMEDAHGLKNFNPSDKTLNEIGVKLPDEKLVKSGKEASYEVEMPVRLYAKHVKLLETQARQDRIDERQKWVGLGLGGFVALLLVAMGYLRLEEATKGFYTTLLRLSAVGILALVGLFLYRLSGV